MNAVAYLYNALDPVGDPGHFRIVHAAREEYLSPILQLQHLLSELHPPATQTALAVKEVGFWEDSFAVCIPSYVLIIYNAQLVVDSSLVSSHSTYTSHRAHMR